MFKMTATRLPANSEFESTEFTDFPATSIPIKSSLIQISVYTLIWICDHVIGTLITETLTNSAE